MQNCDENGRNSEIVKIKTTDDHENKKDSDKSSIPTEEKSRSSNEDESEDEYWIKELTSYNSFESWMKDIESIANIYEKDEELLIGAFQLNGLRKIIKSNGSEVLRNLLARYETLVERKSNLERKERNVPRPKHSNSKPNREGCNIRA